MMEFLLYLTTAGRDVYSLLSQKIRVVENNSICRKHNIYGWFDSGTGVMSICTSRIKSNPEARYYMNETLLHEAVHVSQYCKNGKYGMKPLGISPYDMPLSSDRKQDLKTAVSMGKGSGIDKLEHEAFWMEDKPEKVKYVVKKYCF